MQYAELDWTDGHPYSTLFNDVYFSVDGGLAETRHVFLHNNQLAPRFADLPAGATFTIGETGFGTGLNFLAAWECFATHAPADARLTFLSVEKYPLRPADLQRALALWPQLADYSMLLLQTYPLLEPGWHTLTLGHVTLRLGIGDALTQYQLLTDAAVNAWFLDGFAPSKNPELWQQALFTELRRLSAPQATLATFSCAGAMRRALQVTGFEVKKVPGYGSKRQMTIGILSEH